MKIDISAAENLQTDVIIVGGGPVGLGLAIDLAQRGIQTTVIEKYDQLHPVPKGQNMTQRTGEHFKAWGCQEQIRDASPIPHDFGIAGMMAYDTLLSDYHYDWLRRGNVRQYYAADNERLPQYDTERVLRERAAELDSLNVLYGWQAVDVEQDDASVTVIASERKGDGTRQITGRYLVGCDGSGSRVREAVGIEQDIDPHDKRMVLLVFQSPELHELLERYPGKSYFCALKPGLDGYWLFLGRVELGKSWFFHAPVPMDTTADNFDFDTYLHEAVGAEFPIEYDYIGFWDLRIAVAKNYRKGRVFIAGDAAHSHPPYGGYGINSGFEDSRNLGWKIAAELNGWAGPGLLDSYSAERQPVFYSTGHDFIGRYIIEDREFLDTYSPGKDLQEFEAEWRAREEAAHDDVAGFEPHYEGSPVVFGPDGGKSSAVGSHEFRARAGHHLAPQPTIDGGDLYDAFEDGFVLLTRDASSEIAQDFVAAASGAQIPLQVVDSLTDEAWEHYDCSCILVRPDRFVAWAGNDRAGQAAEVLNRSVGH